MQNEMIERPTTRYGEKQLPRRTRRWVVVGLFALVIVAGIVISLLVGSVLIYPVLRLRGHYLAIATLSFGAIVQALALNLDSLTNGPGGLVGVPVALGDEPGDA